MIKRKVKRMKKNLVLTLAVGDVYKKISELTHPLFEEYAKRIDADFIVVDKSECSSPHWEKFTAIYNYLNKYERILYLDTDILIRKDCPDIFSIVPNNKLAIFNEMPFTNQREHSIRDACKEYNITLPKWNGKYYNTGVMVIARKFKQLFKKPEKEIFNFYEQGYLNVVIAKYIQDMEEDVIFELPYKYNRMTCMDKFTGEERFNSYIIHYAGYPSLEFVLSLIKKDIKKWEFDYPEYKYKKHILIDVQGGLGDQVSAEPPIRFLKEMIYPNDDVTVVTHWPRLFKHLNNLKIYSHSEFEFQPDTPYYHVLSLPGPETLMWMAISHLLSHSVDYIAMSLMKRILPNKDKTIKLKPYLSDINEVIEVLGIKNLNELVLVHAGRHWESKTFPKEWWQAVIDDLHKKGLKVCLIGQDEETRGTIDIKLRKGMLDTRNLLSLGGLIALISSAKVLISNDSAPIHIAGAFNNGIVLIPTCKHPDHILPYRHGAQSYRAKALYKKLMCYEYESSPTTVYGSSAHYVPDDFNKYLPDTELVIKEVLKLYEEI